MVTKSEKDYGEIKDWTWDSNLKFGPFNSEQKLDDVAELILDQSLIGMDDKISKNGINTIFKGLTISADESMVVSASCAKEFWFKSENLCSMNLQTALALLTDYTNASVIYADDLIRVEYDELGIDIHADLNNGNSITSIVVGLYGLD